MSILTPKIFNRGFLKGDMFSFFTANQANDALPDVIKKFEYALAKKKMILQKLKKNYNFVSQLLTHLKNTWY